MSSLGPRVASLGSAVFQDYALSCDRTYPSLSYLASVVFLPGLELQVLRKSKTRVWLLVKMGRY